MKRFRACEAIGRLRKNKRIRKGMYRYVVTKDHNKDYNKDHNKGFAKEGNNETKVGKSVSEGKD